MPKVLLLSLLTLLSSISGAEEFLSWHYSYQDALAEARATKKPLIVEFRCAPCINGREFDAQVLYTKPNSHRGKLLKQFVRARITTMTGVDIAHFDRDWHNSLYYFIINANEDIYMRYGGRDEASATTYLNLDSLELALSLGLKEHEKFLAGSRPSPPRPRRRTPANHPLVKKNVISTGRCTECHLIADYTAQEKQLAGTLDPISDLYQSPDIQSIGLHLDIPKGLLLKNTSSAAKQAGLLPGDTITAINQQSVLTFGDLQYYYNKVPRSAEAITLTVHRNQQSYTLTLTLPDEWWKTDLSFRHWSLETQLYFKAQSLTTEEKVRLKLPPEGFASKITHIDFEAFLSRNHQLKVGDIITAVDGRYSDPRTSDLKAHIQLCHSAGKTRQLTLIRDQSTLTLPLLTGRKAFRKATENLIAPDQSEVHWSQPESITKGKQVAASYRACIANQHLIIEVKHQPSWHTYAMDNPARAIATRGFVVDQDLPTTIHLPNSLNTSGPWLQSPPHNYSNPSINWLTWGFEGTSYFAIKLLSTPQADTQIRISSQACNKDSCAAANALALKVPPPNATQTNLMISLILESLIPVAK
ncbi:Trx7/PDZ domain-containing (seleno)protein [Rubritalea tangerina]|uniref:Trx7/PDZ domain-containing (Seleno)protein n=2 Tax=Rubritalea tangerina TaxID=430798 RepID=A0ABW4ZA25_9BACT